MVVISIYVNNKRKINCKYVFLLEKVYEYILQKYMT